MKRRALLGVVGVGGTILLAGCTTTGNPDSTSSPSSQSPSATMKPGELQRHLALAGVDEVADDRELRIEAELLDAAITDAATARVRVTTTNEGPERGLSIGTDGCDLFNRTGGRSSPEGLWLYRADATDSIDRKDDRWVPDFAADQPRGFGGYACPTTAYATGESVTTEYEVWDDYRVSGYLEPGTYRWETEVRVWDDPAAEASDSPTSAFTWGFSLEVTDPSDA